MKYLIYLFSVLFCLTIPVIGFAQTELTDSLTAVLKNPSLGEKEKPVLLNQLAEIYRTNKNYGLAESKASESARIALQNKDYTDAVKAYTLLVNIKTSTGQLSSAKRTSDSTLVLAKKAKDPVAMAYAYYAQVLVYKILDDAQNVVKFCGLALKQLEKKSDPYIASKIYYRLYAVYSGTMKQKQICMLQKLLKMCF
jgi:tetratricopeptide (TPR) repeat protein